MIWYLLACNSPSTDSAQITAWFDMEQWRQMSAEEDFSDHRPAEVNCPVTAFQIELDQLEIQTDSCNYAALLWDTNVTIPAHTILESLVLHTGLWALEDTEAHVALYINGELFWEEYPPIPSDTAFFFYDQEWNTEIPAGSTVHLHLHNHGANNWKFGYFQVQ
jgi:hypothetical protein